MADLNSNAVLEWLQKNGKIDLAHIQDEMMNEERKELLNSHPYSIYEGKDHKWYTYFKDGEKRKKIKRNTKKEIEDIVIAELKKGQVVTIEAVFNKDMEQKRKAGIKPSTIDRYRQCFKRHFVSTGNHIKDIKKANVGWFCDFIEGEVGRCKLKAKAVANLKGLVKSIIKRARREGLIDYTASAVMDDLEVKPFTEYVDDDSQVFTEKELPKLLSYLIEHPDVHNLCILLMLLTGIRCGELVGLRFDDFVSDTSFNVRRAETRYRTDNGYVCELSNVKTKAGYRTVFFDQDYAWIVRELKKLNPFAEYLATNAKGARMTTNAVRKRLYRICEWLGFESKKSPHKCRKTFASIILDAGFDKNLVVAIMGHINISTTEKHYHFDRKSAEVKQKMINNIVDFKVG